MELMWTKGRDEDKDNGGYYPWPPVVPDKLVLGPQFIQVITFPPSLESEQLLLHSVEEHCGPPFGEARASPGAAGGPYVGPAIDDFCHQALLGHYIFTTHNDFL